MDRNESRFHELMNVLAEQCHYQLSVQTIALYDKSLSKYGYPAVNGALMRIFETRKGGDRFPSVADILDKMGVVVSDRSMAVDCANMIFWTFAKWRKNYCDRDDFEQMFRERIGDLPWTVVERMGGYAAVYREWNECGDLSSLRAQLRDGALSVIELSRAGEMQHLVTGVAPTQIGGKVGKK